MPFPIFGNIISLATSAPGYEIFKNHAKKFGPIYTFWMGEQPLIIVTDYKVIQNTFINDADAYEGRDFFSEAMKIFPGINWISLKKMSIFKLQKEFMELFLQKVNYGKKVDVLHYKRYEILEWVAAGRKLK